MRHYTPEEIRDLYDTNPNMTLRQLSRITGRNVWNLKGLLMPKEENVSAYVAEGLGENK